MGGARNRTSERSATGWSSQRDARRRITLTATAGTTNHSGIRMAVTRLAAATGTNAANTTSPTQRTATALRDRGVLLTTRLFYIDAEGRACLRQGRTGCALSSPSAGVGALTVPRRYSRLFNRRRIQNGRRAMASARDAHTPTEVSAAGPRGSSRTQYGPALR